MQEGTPPLVCVCRKKHPLSLRVQEETCQALPEVLREVLPANFDPDRQLLAQRRAALVAAAGDQPTALQRELLADQGDVISGEGIACSGMCGVGLHKVEFGRYRMKWYPSRLKLLPRFCHPLLKAPSTPPPGSAPRPPQALRQVPLPRAKRGCIRGAPGSWQQSSCRQRRSPPPPLAPPAVPVRAPPPAAQRTKQGAIRLLLALLPPHPLLAPLPGPPLPLHAVAPPSGCWGTTVARCLLWCGTCATGPAA